MCFRGVLLTTKQRTREGNWRSCINSFLLYRCASVLLFETSQVPPLTVRLFLRLFFFLRPLFTLASVSDGTPLFCGLKTIVSFFFFQSLCFSRGFCRKSFFSSSRFPLRQKIALATTFLARTAHQSRSCFFSQLRSRCYWTWFSKHFFPIPAAPVAL